MKPTNRRCSSCKKKVPAGEALTSSLRAFCSYTCLTAYAKSDKGQKAVQTAKKRELKERKETLKTARDYIKEAQVAFNKYIRTRDLGKPCISCGNLPEQKLGGTMDAGHFRSTGSASHLRFNTLNCHAQCVTCNRYGSGMAVDYRISLIKKIGLEAVEKLECDNTPRRFTIDYLKRVKMIFSKKALLLAKLRNKKGCTYP